jgi:hypothetical protein
VSKILPGVPDQPLDELIECLRTARKKRPDLLQGNLAFAISLVSRYSFTFVNDDYEEAASILDEILTSGSPEDSKDELAAMAQGFATLFMTGLARVRSRLGAHSTPENLEAMYLSRSSLGSSSVKELDRLSHSDPIVFDLEKTAKRRFHYFGSTGVETLPGNSPSSQPVPAVSSQDNGGDDWEFNQTFDDMKLLRFEIRNNEDTTKIDEATERARTILASYSPTNLHMLSNAILRLHPLRGVRSHKKDRVS